MFTYIIKRKDFLTELEDVAAIEVVDISIDISTLSSRYSST